MNIGIKKIIFILSGVIIFIVIIILVTAGLVAQQDVVEIIPDNPNKIISSQVDNSQPLPEVLAFVPVTLTAEEKAAREIERFVAGFVERFGTFSNQNEFSHLESLKMFTSDQFYLWARQNTQSSDAGIADSALYYGISTKALDVLLVSNDGATRVYSISTQRQESRGTDVNSRIFPQHAEVELVFSNNLWLVNGVFWQNEES
jgi:hypothetical protein